MARYMIKKKTIYFLIPVIVGIISVGFIIAAEAQTKTFDFPDDAEGFTEFVETTCPNNVWDEVNTGHDNTDGNGDTGSLIIVVDKGGGAQSNCNASLNWNGSWETLGVAPGDSVTGVDGDFDYKVDVATVTSWAVGALEIRASDGTNCGALVATLEARLANDAGTEVNWITVDASEEIAINPSQLASNNLCIRMNAHVPATGNSGRAAEFNFDNIVLAITSISDPNAGIHHVTIGPSVISNGWIKLSDYQAENP